MRTFLKTLIERATEPTPEFFKKLQKYMAAIVAVLAFVEGIAAIGVPVPGVLLEWINWYTLSGPLLTILISQLTSIFRNDDGSVNESKKLRYEQQKERNG